MDKTIDETTLLFILQNLVTLPEEVKISRSIDEKGVSLSVLVSPKDMGIVIGRNGVMANAIKTYMRAFGKAHEMNIRVEFLEPEGSVKYTSKDSNYSDVEKPKDSFNEDLQEFVIN